MDIEGKMQFILDQQVQFSSDLARIHSILERVAATQDRTTAILGIQAEGLSKLEELTQRIGERQIAFEDTVARLELRARDSPPEQLCAVWLGGK